MTESQVRHQYRQYFLGQVAAGPAARLEERMLADDDVCADMQSAEDDLADDYARGRLSESERARVLARGPEQAGRIQFAKALSRRADVRDTLAPSDRLSASWASLALAATVVLAVGGAWLFLGDRSTTPTAVREPAQASHAVLISASLTLGTDRSASRSAQVAVPANAGTVRLRVRLNPADRFDGYAVELRSAGDRVAWGVSDLRASMEGADLLVVADVPAAVLGDGSYELGVRGTSAGASPEALGFATMEVKRIP